MSTHVILVLPNLVAPKIWNFKSGKFSAYGESDGIEEYQNKMLTLSMGFVPNFEKKVFCQKKAPPSLLYSCARTCNQDLDAKWGLSFFTHKNYAPHMVAEAESRPPSSIHHRRTKST